jgi:aspartate aminotransferase-like enzyme
MVRYEIPMTPGPVRISKAAFPALIADFGAGYMEDEFYDTYRKVGEKLQVLMGTANEVIIQSGEAMSILWGALKSCILPGDRVLCISTGFFGSGFADMAKSLKADVNLLEFGFDETLHDFDRIESVVKTFSPKVITVVHCETPSGTLNPIAELGQIKKKYHVPVMIVDAVSSIACTPVKGDEWNADIVMGGSQKGLSLPPTIGFCSISDSAWDVIRKAAYEGYEAFLPWYRLNESKCHPNTPDWNGIAAMDAVLDELADEGYEEVFSRHIQVAEYIRKTVCELGYRLFPKEDAVQSPSVSAVYIPDGLSFSEFNQKIRSFGMGIGGSFGPLEGKIFRIGHMGSQATMHNAKAALDVLAQVI